MQQPPANSDITLAGCSVRRSRYNCDFSRLAGKDGNYPLLMESVAHGTPTARFDILLAFPTDVLKADSNSRFLDELDKLFLSEKSDEELPDWLPFHGGWALYLSYELAEQIEPVLSLPHADDVMPVACAMRCPAAVIRDHQNESVYLVAETGHEELLARMETDLRQAAGKDPDDDVDVSALTEDDPQYYLDGVGRVREYIVEGDVFQVNLSRQWQARAGEHTAANAIFRQLRNKNPSPFACLMIMEDAAVISSSPERLVQVHDGQVETRPIAGTRPRSKDEKSDQAFSEELMQHPKEQAEHIMLIDLERNDLGRVCVPGSIHVNELMVLESYAHVHHIVSNVRGELIQGTTPGKVIAAVFPGGTITGCPKVRCMEIIAELEQTARGAYTGSIGYLNRNGNMDLNILIRTISMQGRQLTVRAGAGIVADSIPENELDETRSKARGMLLALGAAE